MTIAVAMPYFGCPELVERAVRSVLRQTLRDLVVIVVGDGEEPPLAKHTDSRLVVLTLPENRGPYFAQQVVLGASPFEWYAPHAADDWSDPDHLERLMAVGGTAIITGAVWFHAGRHVRLHYAPYEVGLFSTDRLRRLGGHNPAERIGQDTLLMRLLRLTGPVRVTQHPTYHRVRRKGSLMTDPATRPGSRARNEMRRRNWHVYRTARELGSPDSIRAWRLQQIPPAINEELAEQTARLRAMLA